MEKIMSHAELKEQILLLEIKQVNEKYLLEDQFKESYESLKPSTLIKNTIRNITALPDLKENLLNTTMSIAAGFLTKKVAIGRTHNPLKQLLGTLLQIGVTSLVSKNADEIKQSAAIVYGVIKEKLVKHKVDGENI